MKRWRSLNRAQRATVAVAFFSFLTLTFSVGGASDNSESPTYTCVNARTGTRAVIAGKLDGDTADLIAAKHCKGDVAAAGELLRAVHGHDTIMHGAIVGLP